MTTTDDDDDDDDDDDAIALFAFGKRNRFA